MRLSAQIQSRGREGYGHQLAAYIDPGFEGSCNPRAAQLPQVQGTAFVCWSTHWSAPVHEAWTKIPMRTYAVTGRYQGAKSVDATSKG